MSSTLVMEDLHAFGDVVHSQRPSRLLLALLAGSALLHAASLLLSVAPPQPPDRAPRHLEIALERLAPQTDALPTELPAEPPVAELPAPPLTERMPPTTSPVPRLPADAPQDAPAITTPARTTLDLRLPESLRRPASVPRETGPASSRPFDDIFDESLRAHIRATQAGRTSAGSAAPISSRVATGARVERVRSGDRCFNVDSMTTPPLWFPVRCGGEDDDRIEFPDLSRD